MIKKEDVEKFLKDLKVKMGFFGIIFLNRDKNIQGILDLEITPIEREEHIKSLTTEDYFEGPKKDNYAPKLPDYWVFGKQIKSKEVYIKLSLGAGKQALCMSFHIAENKMTYPFKGI